jgi:hypothetical protein
MAWSRIINFYLNVDSLGTASRALLDGTSSAPLNDDPRLTLGDKHKVRLWFRAPQGQSTTSSQVRLDAGSVIVFAAKKTSALNGSILLFSTDTFTEALDGTDYYYEGTVDLATSNSLAAFGASDTSIAITVDVEVQNADNTERVTLQFPAIFRRQGYAGEASVTPAEPVYPAPSAIVVQAVGQEWRLLDGVYLEGKDRTDNAWVRCFIEGRELKQEVVS